MSEIIQEASTTGADHRCAWKTFIKPSQKGLIDVWHFSFMAQVPSHMSHVRISADVAKINAVSVCQQMSGG